MDVPPVICSDDGASVGDLTANTHEINIASERNILERYRKKFQEQEKAGSSRLMISVPIAFGGDGMCLGSTAIGSASSPIRVTSAGSNSIIDVKNRTNENYFEEYDDYSIAAPVAGMMKGRDPPPTQDDSNDEAVSFNPVEMTITGYHI